MTVKTFLFCRTYVCFLFFDPLENMFVFYLKHFTVPRPNWYLVSDKVLPATFSLGHFSYRARQLTVEHHRGSWSHLPVAWQCCTDFSPFSAAPKHTDLKQVRFNSRFNIRTFVLLNLSTHQIMTSNNTGQPSKVMSKGAYYYFS